MRLIVCRGLRWIRPTLDLTVNQLRGNTLPGIIHSSMAPRTGWQGQQTEPECLDRVRWSARGHSRVAADAWVVTLDFIGRSYLVRWQTFWSSELVVGDAAPTGSDHFRPCAPVPGVWSANGGCIYDDVVEDNTTRTEFEITPVRSRCAARLSFPLCRQKEASLDYLGWDWRKRWARLGSGMIDR